MFPPIFKWRSFGPKSPSAPDQIAQTPACSEPPAAETLLAQCELGTSRKFIKIHLGLSENRVYSQL